MVAYNFQLLRIEIPKKKKIEKPSKKNKSWTNSSFRVNWALAGFDKRIICSNYS